MPVTDDMLDAAMNEARITGSVTMMPRERMRLILQAALDSRAHTLEELDQLTGGEFYADQIKSLRK